jgi:hypothetical protein
MIIDTHDYNVHLDINDDINVIFKPLGDADYNLLSQAINDIKISNDTDVIILWAPVGRLYGDQKSIKLLNDFYQQIKNPLVLFSGSLTVDAPNLMCLHQPINLFRYITKIEQPQERPIIIAKPKKFLYTSTKNYFSRAYILQHLINNGLADQGIISYRCLNEPGYIERYLNVPTITDACASVSHLLPYGGLAGDTFLQHQTKPEYAVADSYLSIITETYYNGPIFLSEKVYYAMMYNHFFVFAGPANSLAYLRSQGFKTFSHIVDESYDLIQDPVNRLQAMVSSLDKFLAKSLEEIETLYKDNLDIFDHNRKLVLATEINNQVNSALYKAIAQRSSI